ncbi:hypothetical protein [Kushneria aurantia]|uniref:Tryptophan synthase subunit beta like protein n=1 Tax=Kushneria aurantia TaxID=504092 RepID=A0ABV6G6B3_9GAMM|nr:hypothetical protein [Kushneria aurantia]
MLYVKRDSSGEIVMASREPTEECREVVELESGELMAFMSGRSEQEARFIASDLAFVRVVEDLLEVLLSKGVISFTDLPEAARNKVMERKSLRRGNRIDLLGEEGGII